MKTVISLLTVLLASACPLANAAPAIIIKTDDLRIGKSQTVSPEWQRLADFIKNRKIKASIGIICDSLEGDHPQYFQWIKDLYKTGLVEFWLHAYDHKSWTAPDGTVYNEYDHRPYEEEVQRVAHCQQLAREKLGFTFRTFGPPGTDAAGPAVDDNAWKAFAADPDIKTVFYVTMDDVGEKLEATTKLRLLTRVWQVNIEHPLFVPSLEQFQRGYAAYADKRDYFYLQGHPQHWNEAAFAEFTRIVDFATAQGCAFVTPSEAVARPVAPGRR